jgi:hypothetical protein
LQPGFHQSRHGTAQLACGRCLLRGGGDVLLPFLREFFAFLCGQRLGWTILGLCAFAIRPLLAFGLIASSPILFFRIAATTAGRFLRGCIVGRCVRGVATLTAFALIVVQVLIKRLVIQAVIQAGIDFFRRHVVKLVKDHRFRRWNQAVVIQQRVDREVARQIPLALHAMSTADEMAERAMQRFMSKHELGLRQ